VTSNTPKKIMEEQKDYIPHGYCMEKSGLAKECAWQKESGSEGWKKCPHTLEPTRDF